MNSLHIVSIISLLSYVILYAGNLILFITQSKCVGVVIQSNTVTMETKRDIDDYFTYRMVLVKAHHQKM